MEKRHHPLSSGQLTDSIKKYIQPYVRSVWFFPSLILFAIVTLSILGISGSSIGIYDGIMNNHTPKDLGVISTEPRIVRSDEWLVTTQMTVAQYNAGFPKINENIGEGQNMAILLDVPYKDWSVFFKPQNLIFFIAPLNFAFAFKWWLLAGFLAVSGYFLFLKLLSRRHLEAAFFGAILFLSPFVQWWYSAGTIVPIACGFVLLTLLLMVHDTKNLKKQLLLGAAFCYFATVFALMLYPPFQVPVFLVILAFYLIFLVLKFFKEKDRRKELFKAIAVLAGAAVVVLMILAVYIIQNHTTIDTITNTAYPGKRIIAPGDYPLLHPFTSHLSTFLQNNNSATTYKELYPVGSNQSESSNFILPILLLMGLAAFFLYKIKNLDITSRAFIGGSLFILILFFCNIYVPIGESFYKLIGLTIVPHNRLLIGVGFALFVLLAGLYRAMADKHTRPKLSNRMVLLLFAAVTIGYVVYTYILFVRNPGFITNIFVAFGVTLLIPLWFLAFLKNKLALSLLFLLILSVASTGWVNPLERNLDELTDTDFSRTIVSIKTEDPAARWVTNNLVLENYVVANGAKSLSGTYAYPQLDIWKDLDPTRASEKLYNRYAHVSFIFDDLKAKPEFSLPAGDNFLVRISPCDDFFRKKNVNYFYGTNPIPSRCLQPITQVGGNQSARIFIYKRISIAN